MGSVQLVTDAATGDVVQRIPVMVDFVLSQGEGFKGRRLKERVIG